MDMFGAFLLWTFLTCSAAFGVGIGLNAKTIVDDCNKKGEIIKDDTVLACKITHVIKSGKRIAVE